MFHPTSLFLALVSMLTGFVLHDATSLGLLAILSIVTVPVLRTTRVRLWLRSVCKGWCHGWRSCADAVWKHRHAQVRIRGAHVGHDPRTAAATQWHLQEQAMQAAALHTAITELGEDMDTFTRDWSENRAHFYQRNQLALPDPQDAPPPPHQHLLYAFMALEHALAHLGSPVRGVRVTTEELAFYQDWVSGLRLQLATFADLYWEQRSRAQQALWDATRTHTTLGHLDEAMAQDADYQHTEGALATLEYLLYDGGVHAASALPLIEAFQQRVQERFERSTAYMF